MPISTDGKLVFMEPGDGRTVLSMDGGEFDLFGKYTAIKTTAMDTFEKINDFMVEKKVEDPKTFQLIIGVGATVILAGLAVAAVAVATTLTGGLALTVMGAVAAGFTRAAIETGIYTATSYLTDTVTDSHRSNEDFMKGLAISGGGGFVTGALSYLNPTISFTPGPSLAMEGGGTMAAAIPTIVTNVADTVLVLDDAFAVSTVLSAALGAGGGERDKEGIQIENGNSVKPTKEGLDIIEKHLSGDMQADYNDAMIERIRNILKEGGELTGPDAEFYRHEIEETRLMNQGMDYNTAHGAALDKYGVTEFDLYHPDVIESMPEWFGLPWFDYWGISH